MKKLRLLLALIAASIGSVQSAWARTAPTFPKAQTLASGQTYYMYNPGSGRFIYRDNSSLYAYPDKYSAVTVTNVEGNVYTFQFDGSSYYLYSGNNSVGVSTSTTTSYLQYRKFRIEATEGGYTIQRDYDGNETYLGNATGNTSIVSNMTSNIVWQFYDADGVGAIFRYSAKKALYDALVSADDYSFAVEAYEALYDNDEATNDELTAAANAINNALMWKDMLVEGETEFPIYTELTGSATWNYSSGKYSNTKIVNGEGCLKATVEVDQDATLVYDYSVARISSNYSFDVYLNGKLYQHINNYEGYNGSGYYQKYFVELNAGRHTIEWKATNESSAITFILAGIAAYKTPTITVNLTLAGSMDTKVDNVKDVRKLVVKGNMNSEDWECINTMVNLFDLDLTETTVTSLPKINPGSFFHKLKLPKGLTTIQASALASRPLDEISLPSTLTIIEARAFQYTRIKKAILPETVMDIGSYAFANNESLQEAYIPATSIGSYAFQNCSGLTSISLPAATSIGSYAFQSCSGLTSISLPAATSISSYVFQSCSGLTSVSLPAATSIGSNAFLNCSSLTSVSLPKCLETLGASAFSGCNKLTDVYCHVSMPFTTTAFTSSIKTSATLHVPTFGLNYYKLSDSWKDFKSFVAIDETIESLTISTSLTITDYAGLADKFNLKITSLSTSEIGHLTVSAGSPWNLGKFNFNNYRNVSTIGNAFYYYPYCNSLITYNEITADEIKLELVVQQNQWNFISFPFDVNVSDIEVPKGTNWVIRKYSGKDRAALTGNTWQDMPKGTTLKAGEGYILHCINLLRNSAGLRFYVKPVNNANKNNIFAYSDVVTPLAKYPSELANNRSWNLVGNPYPSYFNTKAIEHNGVITVWSGSVYCAYSPIDDDYVLRPNEAFFVQCPDDATSMTFKAEGRQHEQSISGSESRALMPQANSHRKVYNFTLSDGEMTDRTRLVVNPDAKMDYEISCDASKFMSDNPTMTQIYVLDGGIRYAIDERPLGNGIITLGTSFGKSGSYSIALNSKNIDNQAVLLTDKETNCTTDLSKEAYTFFANAGMSESRFTLNIGSDDATGIIKAIDNSQQTNKNTFFDLQGRKVNTMSQKGIYLMKENGKSRKVLK